MTDIARADLYANQRDEKLKELAEERHKDMIRVGLRHPELVETYKQELNEKITGHDRHLQELRYLMDYLDHQRQYVKNARGKLRSSEREEDKIEYEELKKTLKRIDETMSELYIQSQDIEREKGVVARKLLELKQN
jgi:hypothetical protein